VRIAALGGWKSRQQSWSGGAEIWAVPMCGADSSSGDRRTPRTASAPAKPGLYIGAAAHAALCH